MRPAQQNRRMRGRGNNNRKGPNPLSRNYESNGPDVKIRGNAQHIAEKYMTLARDAQATGDRVIAENYLQHAEHYNRIILAAQAQNPAPVQRDEGFDDDYDDEDTMDQGHSGQSVSHQEVYDGSGPQPVIEGTPAEVMYGEENSRSSGRNNRQQNNRQDRGDRNDRNDRNERNNDRNNDRQGRMQRPRRHQRPEYGADQGQEIAAAPQVPYEQSAEQPVVTSTFAEPVVADVSEVAEAPVTRRRPRAAAPVVQESDAAPAAEVTPEASADAVAADEAPAPRTRRVLRPRRTTRTAKADADTQDQDTALAETE